MGPSWADPSGLRAAAEGLGHCKAGKGSDGRTVSREWRGPTCLKRFSVALLENRLAGVLGGEHTGEQI